MRQRSGTIIIFVRFDVCFIFQVEPVFITQIIPVRIIRIVGVADMVDIGTFHQHDFIFHHFTGDGVAYCRITFVTVDTFQFNRFAVYIVVTSCQPEFIFRSRRVFDLYFAEADNRGEGFYRTAFFVFQFSDQCIAVWLFCRPFIRVLYIQNSFGPDFLSGCQYRDGNGCRYIFYFCILIGI